MSELRMRGTGITFRERFTAPHPSAADILYGRVELQGVTIEVAGYAILSILARTWEEFTDQHSYTGERTPEVAAIEHVRDAVRGWAP